jgi:hypothetical protein
VPTDRQPTNGSTGTAGSAGPAGPVGAANGLNARRGPGSSWRTLAAASVPEEENRQALAALLAGCLPAGLRAGSLHRAIEQALADALVRRHNATRPRPTDPQIIISCFEPEEGAPAAPCGWSFFVLERPAAPGSRAHDVIELCLYPE